MAGVWQQHEVWDGTYTLDDLLDWHEMHIVKLTNDKNYKVYLKTIGGEE